MKSQKIRRIRTACVNDVSITNTSDDDGSLLEWEENIPGCQSSSGHRQNHPQPTGGNHQREEEDELVDIGPSIIDILCSVTAKASIVQTKFPFVFSFFGSKSFERGRCWIVKVTQLSLSPGNLIRSNSAWFSLPNKLYFFLLLVFFFLLFLFNQRKGRRKEKGPQMKLKMTFNNFGCAVRMANVRYTQQAHAIYDAIWLLFPPQLFLRRF